MFKLKSKQQPKPFPETLDELYRAVRMTPLTTRFDTLSTFAFFAGLSFLLVTIGCGAIVYFWPSAKHCLTTIALGSFALGLLAFLANMVLSTIGSVLSIRKHLSQRFHKSHSTSVQLATLIAARYPRKIIEDGLHTTRLEMKINARAPGKLPIVAGFVTASAAATSYILGLPETSKAAAEGTVASITAAVSSNPAALNAASVSLPDFAWIALGVALAVVMSRAMIHETQDRLMRMENVPKASVLGGSARSHMIQVYARRFRASPNSYLELGLRVWR